MRSIRGRWLGVVFLLTGLGCGSEDVPRAVVSGRVTFDGQPVSRGMIRFLIDGRPTAIGQIIDGQYKIDYLGGVPIGAGKVEIEGFEETGRVIAVGVEGKTQVEAKQIVPARYNSRTELVVQIPAERKFEKDFELTR